MSEIHLKGFARAVTVKHSKTGYYLFKRHEPYLEELLAVESCFNSVILTIFFSEGACEM